MSTNIEEKILHGTTTVGIKATDGVVLCADMRLAQDILLPITIR